MYITYNSVNVNVFQNMQFDATNERKIIFLASKQKSWMESLKSISKDIEIFVGKCCHQ